VTESEELDETASMHSDMLQTLETYYDAAPRPFATTEEVGPFTLFLQTDPGFWSFYARPRLGNSDVITRNDVQTVRARQLELGVPESIEWVHEVTPSLLEAARASRLTVAECPLMVLTDLKAPTIDASIELRVLESEPDVLDAVTAVVDAGFRESDDVGRPKYPTRAGSIRDGLLGMVGAFDEVGPIGGGSHAPRRHTSEITGIGVLPRARRRGLGAAIAAALATDARNQDVTTVFLSAQTDAVARVYRRVGFERVGTACIAEPTSSH
jgi:ribosomal protein S18 acetylase RimI-like enzyme